MLLCQSILSLNVASFTLLFFAEPIELGRRVLFFGVAALEATLELDLI